VKKLKKEKHDEKKREFRNVEQDKWSFSFSFSLVEAACLAS
jgi:hypothetical protein